MVASGLRRARQNTRSPGRSELDRATAAAVRDRRPRYVDGLPVGERVPCGPVRLVCNRRRSALRRKWPDGLAICVDVDRAGEPLVRPLRWTFGGRWDV